MRRARYALALVVFLAADALDAQEARRPFLFKDARGELASARAKGEREVTLVIAARTGATAKLARTITAMGGTIRYRDDDVDYLRARVPVDSVERIARDASVHSLDITSSGTGRSFSAAPIDADRPATSVATTLPSAADDTTKRVWPPVLEPFPLTNPYSPLGDMGAVEFRRANPTFDGRGVTMALIDLNLDALLPELQWATTLDGKRTPKIVVYETAIDPDDEDDGGWVAMTDTVSTADGRFVYQGKSYTAPRAGTFRVAHFDEARFDSLGRAGIDKDINRDGNPEGSSRLFGVLWDERSNDVWVDTDQDLSFANEKALTDYSVRAEFGVFGTDKPETPVRESVSFGIQTDRAKKRVSINAGVASHASLVVGAALASRGTDGRFEGMAPGARLANIAEGGAAYGQTEAVIRALKNPLVDLAWLEQSSNITRGYLLRDGRLVPTVIYGRLIEKYRKPIIIPTHNYPVVNGTDDFVMARGSIGVGGHEGKDNFFTNHGVRVEHDDNLLITGGYGPMGDGSMGPDLISASNVLSTNRGFLPGTVMNGLYRLPPGYTIAGGTSTATPVTAGAVAMLISAAKQTGVRYDAFRIERALTMSARYVPHLSAYKQGNGVTNVGAAWELLRAMDSSRTSVAITSRAPVKHAYSHLLATPNEGVGLYEREGWSAGDRGERTITLTRTSGGRAPMTFSLGFVGGDSTFSAPASVTLPLGAPVPVTIRIAPRAAGVHSALLTLAHPSVAGPAFRTLTTIVAAEPLSATNKYRIETKTEVPRPAMRSFFYRVPEGVRALAVDVDGARREVAVAIVRPDTRTAPAARTVASAGNRGFGGGGSGTAPLPRSSYIVTDPMPGVWEVRLTDVGDVRTFDVEQGEKREPVPPTALTLTVSAIGASASALGDAGAVRLANVMSAFTGGVASLPLGAAHRARATIREKEQQVYDIDVPAGTATLLTRASRTSDARADLDVYLFDCTKQECRPAERDADPVGDEIVSVRDPAPGAWKVVVDAAFVPSGSTAYDYLDVLFNPTYGTVAVADQPASRASGAEWSATRNVWDAGAMPAGRSPYAALELFAQPKPSDRFSLGMLEIVPVVATTGSGGRP